MQCCEVRGRRIVVNGVCGEGALNPTEGRDADSLYHCNLSHEKHNLYGTADDIVGSRAIKRTAYSHYKKDE